MIYLSTAYFGNIHYWSKLAGGETILLERHENFVKQSFRTRTDIFGANGVLPLSIPVVKRHNEKMAIGEVEIDYAEAWQRVHLHSIVSAYRNSAYFPHYEERIRPLFERKERFLVDLNDRILDVLSLAVGITPQIIRSERYVPSSEILPPDGDFRESISPKARMQREDASYREVPYYQVFAERYPFTPNLSILDLLFCEGPAAKEVLRQSYIR